MFIYCIQFLKIMKMQTKISLKDAIQDLNSLLYELN